MALLNEIKWLMNWCLPFETTTLRRPISGSHRSLTLEVTNTLDVTVRDFLHMRIVFEKINQYSKWHDFWMSVCTIVQSFPSNSWIIVAVLSPQCSIWLIFNLSDSASSKWKTSYKECDSKNYIVQENEFESWMKLRVRWRDVRLRLFSWFQHRNGTWKSSLWLLWSRWSTRRLQSDNRQQALRS